MFYFCGKSFENILMIMEIVLLLERKLDGKSSKTNTWYKELRKEFEVRN